MAEDLKKCPKCFTDIPKKTTLCPNCKSDLRNWLIKHPIITFFIVMTIVGSLGQNKPSQTAVSSQKQQQISQVSEPKVPTVQKAAIIEKLNIAVTSMIVKKVDGKCRYFFDIRNNDSRPYVGGVKINLMNGKGNNIWNDRFDTTSPIMPKLGTTVYLEANTCPMSLQGEYGINSYTFDVFEKDNIVNSGSGTISKKLENLSL